MKHIYDSTVTTESAAKHHNAVFCLGLFELFEEDNVIIHKTTVTAMVITRNVVNDISGMFDMT